MRRVLLVLIVAALAAAGGYVLGQRAGPSPSGAAPAPRATPAAVGSGGAPRQVAGLARLRPRGGLIKIGTFSENRVARILVEEGQQVEAGQALIELATLPMRHAAVELSAQELRSALARRETLEAATTAALAQAAADLEHEVALLRSQRAEVERDLSVARVELRGAQARLERVVATGSALTAKEREDAGVSRDVAQAQVEGLQASLEQLAAQLPTVQRRGEARRETLRRELARDLARLGVAELEAKVAQARTELGEARVLAPISGRVLKLLARPGQRTGTGSLLYLGDVSRLEAVVEVDQTQIRWVRVGQRATLTSAALSQPLTATVAGVGEMISRNDIFGDDPTAPTNARVVEVLLDVEAGDGVARRLTRLECDARLQVGESE
ncbi:MAG: HlyD family efflux transporter periplasmic adaptor subunit [Planctomycetota bacterium]